MTPTGSTYKGELERFVSAAPLPVTDMIVRPQDGALYFTIGGRRTQSGLYRVTYVGDESTVILGPRANDDSKSLTARRALETLHGSGKRGAIDEAWPFLSDDDRFIRYAARIALEHQPVEDWQKRALAERNPRSLVTAMVCPWPEMATSPCSHS